MKTIRVRLANAVILCGATGLAVAITFAGSSAQSDDQGTWKKASSSIEDRLDTHQNKGVTRKLQALFNENEGSEVRHASAVGEDEHAVEQVAGETQQRLTPEPNPNMERKSDVLQHLEELYQKEGREMPPMSLEQAPNTSNPVPDPPHRAATQQTQQSMQQPMQPPATYAAEPEAPPKKPGLLRRLFGSSKSSNKSAAKSAAQSDTPPTSRTSKQQNRTAKAPAKKTNPQNQYAPTQSAAPARSIPTLDESPNPAVTAPTQAAVQQPTAVQRPAATTAPTEVEIETAPVQVAAPTTAHAQPLEPMPIAAPPKSAPVIMVLKPKEQEAPTPAQAPFEVQQTTTDEEAGKVRLATPPEDVVQDKATKKATPSPVERTGVEDPLLMEESSVFPQTHSAPATTPVAPAAPAAPVVNAAPALNAAPAQIPQGDAAQSLPAETADSAEDEEVGRARTSDPNPFTGLKLNDDASAPAQEPTPIPAAPNANPFEPNKVEPKSNDVPPWAQTDNRTSATVTPPAAVSAAPAKPAELPMIAEPAATPAPVAAPAESNVAVKLHQIVERSGKPGLKGFCVVALRDDRELVDSQPEYQATFEGKSYFFSTAKAKVKFLQNPRKYAPVAGGNDIVALAHTHQSVPGTLDHSLWYRERLFLFSNTESRDSFMHHPQQYIDAALSPAAK